MNKKILFIIPVLLFTLTACPLATIGGAVGSLAFSNFGDFSGAAKRTAVRDYERLSNYEAAMSADAVTARQTCLSKALPLDVKEYMVLAKECLAFGKEFRPSTTIGRIFEEAKEIRNSNMPVTVEHVVKPVDGASR